MSNKTFISGISFIRTDCQVVFHSPIKKPKTGFHNEGSVTVPTVTHISSTKKGSSGPEKWALHQPLKSAEPGTTNASGQGAANQVYFQNSKLI